NGRGRSAVYLSVPEERALGDERQRPGQGHRRKELAKRGIRRLTLGEAPTPDRLTSLAARAPASRSPPRSRVPAPRPRTRSDRRSSPETSARAIDPTRPSSPSRTLRRRGGR